MIKRVKNFEKSEAKTQAKFGNSLDLGKYCRKAQVSFSQSNKQDALAQEKSKERCVMGAYSRKNRAISLNNLRVRSLEKAEKKKTKLVFS